MKNLFFLLLLPFLQGNSQNCQQEFTFTGIGTDSATVCTVTSNPELSNATFYYEDGTSEKFEPLFGSCFTVVTNGKIITDICVKAGCSEVCYSSLPVELSYFAAMPYNDDVLLNWSSDFEDNVDEYIIQRSNEHDGSYDDIGSTWAIGFSNEKNGYSFIDNDPWSGVVYYRLKMIDFDGSFQYSKIASVFISNPDFQVLDNGKIIKFPKETNAKIEVYSTNGVLLLDKTIQSQYIAAIPTDSLPSGIYYVRVREGRKQNTIKLIK